MTAHLGRQPQTDAIHTHRTPLFRSYINPSGVVILRVQAVSLFFLVPQSAMGSEMQCGMSIMSILDRAVAGLKGHGVRPIPGVLPVFEAGEMDHLLWLIERCRVSTKQFPLVREYVTLRMFAGHPVDQILIDLERLFSPEDRWGYAKFEKIKNMNKNGVEWHGK